MWGAWGGLCVQGCVRMFVCAQQGVCARAGRGAVDMHRAGCAAACTHTRVQGRQHVCAHLCTRVHTSVEIHVYIARDMCVHVGGGDGCACGHGQTRVCVAVGAHACVRMCTRVDVSCGCVHRTGGCMCARGCTSRVHGWVCAGGCAWQGVCTGKCPTPSIPPLAALWVATSVGLPPAPACAPGPPVPHSPTGGGGGTVPRRSARAGCQVHPSLPGATQPGLCVAPGSVANGQRRGGHWAGSPRDP